MVLLQVTVFPPSEYSVTNLSYLLFVDRILDKIVEKPFYRCSGHNFQSNYKNIRVIYGLEEK